MRAAIGIFDVLFVTVGYVLAIYSWPWVRLKINGAAVEYDRLRAQADKVINSVRR